MFFDENDQYDSSSYNKLFSNYENNHLENTLLYCEKSENFHDSYFYFDY